MPTAGLLVVGGGLALVGLVAPLRHAVVGLLITSFLVPDSVILPRTTSWLSLHRLVLHISGGRLRERRRPRT